MTRSGHCARATVTGLSCVWKDGRLCRQAVCRRYEPSHRRHGTGAIQSNCYPGDSSSYTRRSSSAEISIDVQLAILGNGSIARAHVQALHTLGIDGLAISSVMGRVPESTDAFAAEHGIARSTIRLEDVLEDNRISAVIVCSPSDLHAEQTERALRAGKHVLCEIPLATSLADVDRLIAIADE